MKPLGISLTMLALLLNTWLYQSIASAQKQNTVWTGVVDATGSTFRQPTATRTVYASQLAGIHLDGSLTANTGTDDRATLQTVLDTASSTTPLVLIIDGVAAIATANAGLVVKSHTTIQCLGWSTGFNWLGSAAANQQALITNANPLGIATPVDTDITIRGCAFNGNYASGHGGSAGPSGFNPLVLNSDGYILAEVRFVGVTNVHLADLQCNACTGINFHFGNAFDFLVENIQLNDGGGGAFGVGGVQFEGPSSRGIIRNISGTVPDDMVALNADDGQSTACLNANWHDLFGPHAASTTMKTGAITKVLVEDVTSVGSYEALRLLSGTSLIDEVVARRLKGTAVGHLFSADIFPPCFGGVYAGNFGTISIEDVSVSLTDITDEYGLGGSTLMAKYKNLTVGLILEDYAPSTTAPVFLTSAYTNIGTFNLNIRSSQTSGLPAPILSMAGGAINNLTLTGSHGANFGSTQATNPVVSCTGGTISRLTSSLSADYMNNVIVADGCTLTTLAFGNGVHTNAGAHGTVNIASGSIGTLSQGNYVSAQLKEGAGTFGPTPSVGTCGTIGTGSTNAAGFISSATSGSCVSVLTFSGAKAPTGWSCGISNATTANIITQTGSSTTTATFTGTTVSGDVLRYTCQSY